MKFERQQRFISAYFPFESSMQRLVNNACEANSIKVLSTLFCYLQGSMNNDEISQIARIDSYLANSNMNLIFVSNSDAENISR